MSKSISLITLLLAAPLYASATDYVTVSQPRQQCWNEQVAVASHDDGAAIVGGIAGGIIGNQVGRGNGRIAATAIGAATGAIVGDRISGGQTVSYQTVQRCRTVYEQVRVPVAPTVTYVESRPYYTPVVQTVVYETPRHYHHGHAYGWREHEWEEHHEWREHGHH